MSNVTCYVFGHKPTEVTAGVEACDRCGDTVAYYVDGTQWTDRERYGLIEPLRIVCRRILQWSWPRCYHCGKRLVFRRKVGYLFCSLQCEDDWIPF